MISVIDTWISVLITHHPDNWETLYWSQMRSCIKSKVRSRIRSATIHRIKSKIILYDSVGFCLANISVNTFAKTPTSVQTVFIFPLFSKLLPKAERSRFGLSGVVEEGQLGQCGERQVAHLPGLLCCPILPLQLTRLKLEIWTQNWKHILWVIRNYLEYNLVWSVYH